MRPFLTDAERHASRARPTQAEADVLEGPFVAALLIVDDQDAVLQADFIEVLSVKTGQAEAVEPIEAGQQSACGSNGRDRGGLRDRAGLIWGLTCRLT